MTDKHLAGYVWPGSSPPHISIDRPYLTDIRKQVEITVRGQLEPTPMYRGAPIQGTATIVIPEEEWRRIVAESVAKLELV